MSQGILVLLYYSAIDRAYMSYELILLILLSCIIYYPVERSAIIYSVVVGQLYYDTVVLYM